MDNKTLEHHHNAWQIMFTLLLHSLAEKAPDVMDDWLGELFAVLDTTPGIPKMEREIMERTFVAISDFMKRPSSETLN